GEGRGAEAERAASEEEQLRRMRGNAEQYRAVRQGMNQRAAGDRSDGRRCSRGGGEAGQLEGPGFDRRDGEGKREGSQRLSGQQCAAEDRVDGDGPEHSVPRDEPEEWREGEPEAASEQDRL